MEKEILFKMRSPYRDDFRITAFRFGSGDPTVAIVGTMRGDEIQQQYVCSQVVAELQATEQAGGIVKGKSILVIPSCNPFSMNVSRRFWTMDNTDINRMFPGYDKGETTQRIAAVLFNRLQHYKYGMQLASFYVPGDFVPHVRMLRTGYEDIETAKLFGLPFVTIRQPLPFDTTLLNYNWQIWETKAYSLYGGPTNSVNDMASQQTIEAIMRFLNNIGAIKYATLAPGYASNLVIEEHLSILKAHRAGILYRLKTAGAKVAESELIARIIDPYLGNTLEEVRAPKAGIIFFSYNKSLTLENGILYRIL